MPWTPKTWRSESNPLGPPAAGTATPLSGSAITAEFTAAKAYIDEQYAALQAWANATFGPVSASSVVGINDASGWGAGQAATIYNAGIHWARTNLTEFLTAAHNACNEGFSTVGIIANADDGTLLTTLNSVTVADQAVSELQSETRTAVAEFMNEPYFKGNQAWPVAYARLYMAALAAIRAAGFTQKLLFASYGDFNMEGGTYTCTISNGSPVVTTATTENLTGGQGITGTNIPVGATVDTVDSRTQFTMSANATASGSRSLTFGSYWCQAADDNEGWLAKACFHVDGLWDAVLANGITLHPYGGVTEDSNGHNTGLAAVNYLIGRYTTEFGGCPEIWITEFGFRIEPVHSAGETTGYYAHDMTEQASKISAALEYLTSLSKVKGTFYYESHDNFLNIDCTTSNGSAVVTTANTTGLQNGSTVSGTYIQGSTTVASVDSPTQFTMSKTATGAGTNSLHFSGVINVGWGVMEDSGTVRPGLAAISAYAPAS